MSFFVVIPARYRSTRLPGKPLIDIEGKPMIQRVYEIAKKSNALEVFVATDHQDILNCCDSFGAKAVVTSTEHPSGTDRIAEAATKLDLEDDALIVNLQGDEPFLNFLDINNLYDFFVKNKSFNICTLFSKFTKDQDQNDTNLVKVWVDSKGEVKKFSRKNNLLEDKEIIKRLHIGIYAYKVKFIKQFVKWDQSKNEKIENLEQLRAIDRKKKIGATESLSKIHIGIDTVKDLNKARKLIRNA